MIPRYQRILFLVLLVGSVVLAVLLLQHHRNNYTLRDNASNADLPMEGSGFAASEAVTLDVANDTDGSITPTQRTFALPSEPAVRTRALLEHLMNEYALPDSPHHISGNGSSAVEDVYLVNLPLTAPTPKSADGTVSAADFSAASPAAAETPGDNDPLAHETGELAIINLRGPWCDAHPSGITTETLTLDSILGTLHANLPQITRVRFLVDGQTRSTLAGNVALDRTYTVADTATAPAQKND